jgi:hypothetical protein
MAADSYEEKEKLLRRKHELEWENFKARRELQSTRLKGLSIIPAFSFGPDPFELEEAQLREKQSRELLALMEERTAVLKAEDSNQPEKKRFSGQVASKSAARKLEAFVESKGMGFTEFAIQAGTTDRTIRRFRRTGQVRRDIFQNIAKVMGLKPEELLK